MGAPILSLAAVMLLTHSAADDTGEHISLGTAVAAFTLSLMECGAPIIPLALLPANNAYAPSPPRSAAALPPPHAFFPPVFTPCVHSHTPAPPRPCIYRSCLGTAYGTIEAMFILAQLTITLLVGVLRESTQSFAVRLTAPRTRTRPACGMCMRTCMWTCNPYTLHVPPLTVHAPRACARVQGALGLMWGGFAAAIAVAIPLAAHTKDVVTGGAAASGPPPKGHHACGRTAAVRPTSSCDDEKRVGAVAAAGGSAAAPRG